MKLVIEGHHLPGSTCGPYADVHVGVQIGRDPAGLVAADAPTGRWELDLRVVDVDGEPDFRGAAVHGRPGERYAYLTWGEGSGEDFAMFRRAKLMLADLPDPWATVATARVHLTDERGWPRCARLGPPALEWA